MLVQVQSSIIKEGIQMQFFEFSVEIDETIYDCEIEGDWDTNIGEFYVLKETLNSDIPENLIKKYWDKIEEAAITELSNTDFLFDFQDDL
jgi:hypothetical protein